MNAPTIEFKEFRRKQIAELADWAEGFDMTGVSVSDADKQAGSPKVGDKIARNPNNHADRWLVAAAYFADNFEPIQSIESQPVPVEPVAHKLIDEKGGCVWADHPITGSAERWSLMHCERVINFYSQETIASLQSALKLAQEERAEYKRQSEFWQKSSTEWKESRERFVERAEKAESLNRRMLELLKEARGWIRACLNCKDYEWDADQRECAEGTVASIDAELIKEATKCEK